MTASTVEEAVQEEQRISLKDRLQNVIESNIRLENRAKTGEIAIEIVRKGTFSNYFYFLINK